MFKMEADKTHGGMAGNMANNLTSNLAIPTTHQNMMSNVGGKSIESENLEILAHIHDMLDQLNGRGINSLIITVGPLGDTQAHGSQKGQAFLKENPDLVDRFAKICADDVWTLIGAQKRFLELGRTNHNKTGTNFPEKGEFPLDFSHERANYFPTQQQNDRQNNPDAFMPGIMNQGGGNQNKGYQPNSFIHGSFGQYMSDARPGYPSGSFFQGGFTQGVAGTESYPQPAFMPGIDTNKDFGNLGSSMMPGQTSASSTPASTSQDKAGISQSEDDIIKEMLTSAPLTDVFKDSSQKMKEKSPKVKEEKDGKKKDSEKKKREKRPETWQRNIKKRLKTEGKAYVNAKGKLVPARTMKSVDCSNCKQKCTEKISEETRQKIFDWFWKLGSYTAQKEFVVSRVTQLQTKTSKRRHVHRLFSFEINGKYEPVCKPFFAKTLGIGDSYIYKAFEQKARDLFVQDGRGKHAPVNKTSEQQIEFMHQHLERFLCGYPLDKPLPKNIHAVKWYAEYLTFCDEHQQKSVSKHIYRKIFQEYVRRYPENPDKKKPGDSTLNECPRDSHPGDATLHECSRDSA